MQYELRHTTLYSYESAVLHGRHVVRQRPRALPYQSVERASVEVTPSAVWRRAARDYFGNEVDYLEVLGAHTELSVTTRSLVTVGSRPASSALPLFAESWEEARRLIASDRSHYEAREYVHDSPLVRRHSALRKFAEATFAPNQPMLESVLLLSERIFREFAYVPNATDVSTPLAQVLRERRGVCQDFAHVAVGALRSLGLAARYVSGYLETLPPPGTEKLVGADASHAWASVYLPEFGWLDFDPTNNVIPGERHVVVGFGRDYSDVSPLKGVVHGGGRHTVKVAVDVIPVGAQREVAEGQRQSQSPPISLDPARVR